MVTPYLSCFKFGKLLSKEACIHEGIWTTAAARAARYDSSGCNPSLPPARPLINLCRWQWPEVGSCISANRPGAVVLVIAHCSVQGRKISAALVLSATRALASCHVWLLSRAYHRKSVDDWIMHSNMLMLHCRQYPQLEHYDAPSALPLPQEQEEEHAMHALRSLRSSSLSSSGANAPGADAPHDLRCPITLVSHLLITPLQGTSHHTINLHLPPRACEASTPERVTTVGLEACATQTENSACFAFSRIIAHTLVILDPCT